MAPTPNPIWRTDLSRLGYHRFTGKGDLSPPDPLLYPLCFSDSSTLIASFLTRERPAGLPRRGVSNDLLPLRLHAIFLDAATGAVRAGREWPLAEATGGVFCALGGNFIVGARTRLTLYSDDAREVADIDIPRALGPGWSIFAAFESPSGKSLLVQCDWTPPGPVPTHAAGVRGYASSIRWAYQWVDTNTLRPRRSWSGPVESSISISDTQILTASGLYQPGDFALPVVSPVGRVRVAGWNSPDCCHRQFVSDAALVLSGTHRLKLVRTSGSETFDWQFSRDDWVSIGPLPASRDGRRLAVVVWEPKGWSALLDTGFQSVLKRIMVFDIPSRRWIYTLDANRQKIKTVSGLALSPEGSLMAILTNGVVEVYRLPPEQPAQQPAPQQ